ncbi:MAG: rod shape-determining protein MreC [Patescibacteria group bacterium]|jgi:rod shape-determining protein MreC
MKRNNNLVKMLSVSVFLVLILVMPLRAKFRSFAWSAGKVVANPFIFLSQKTQNVTTFVRGIGRLQDENKDLGRKIASLEVDRSRITELEHENELLKRELGFLGSRPNQELIPARIVGREPTTLLDYAIIDKGESDGVVANAPVVSEGALIGQVSEVNKDSAKIILITSKDSIVQAMLQVSRSKGVLRGGISGLSLENISQDVEFSSGEYVVTSGLGGELPEGILIGKARSLQSPLSGIYKSISVEPIIDLPRLEMVFVVRE